MKNFPVVCFRGKSLRAPSFTGLMLFSCLVSSGAALAQTVEYVTFGKRMAYVQTSPTQVKINPRPSGPLYGGPYDFKANVEGQNLGSISPPIFTGPINLAAYGTFYNNGRLVYNAQDQQWRLGLNANDFGAPTKAELDRSFGIGTYTFIVKGATIPLQLSGDAYPNTPVLTLTGGVWANGKYVIEADKPLTMTTNAFTAYGSNRDGVIAFDAPVSGGNTQFRSAVPGTNFMTRTVPASTFAAGQDYDLGANFYALVDINPHPALPGSLNAAYYNVGTNVTVSVIKPVFPMVVSGSITPMVANITAAIQYRPQDVGTTGSVYVFALAPATLVKNAVVPALDKHLGPVAKGDPKDTPLPCILAQLTSSGQLVAASASNMQAYLSGVLGSQGASITILNGVSTPNIQGAVFYVGYGPNSATMLSSGVNRSVVTVPGAQTCQPQAPQAGWWWNKNEPGRGFSIEAQGNRLFMAGYLYDESGRATWTVSGGLTSLDGSLFMGSLQNFSSGQTLTGAYRAPAPPASGGAVTLTFTDARNGTLAWPGGVIPIERYDIALPTSTPPPAFVPENGWWWNASESGRGYFMEFSNNYAFIAGYMYDANGNPLWYASGNNMASPQSFQGGWTQFGNGQTLTGTFRQAVPVNGNVGSVAIQFQDSANATLTLPGGRQIPVTRFLF